MLRSVINTLILSCIIFSAWAYATSTAQVRPNQDNLFQTFAVARRAQVATVDYDLDVAFKKGAETYKGRVMLHLTLQQIDRTLFIDSNDDFVIKKISAGETPISDYKKHVGAIEIPAKYLSAKMSIEIEYEAPFSKTGEGITTTVDPADGSQYIATDFEPYKAHLLFPCLDQPDLKATYRLTVLAPKDWMVISNDVIKYEKKQGDERLSVFNQSKPFSTYLFFIGTGPYVEWKDSYDGIPLTLYARKSLAQYVDDENIFTTTKKGLKFFNEYFGIKYPFPKYGQIFIPEFSWGGMENPGAVALNEKNIYREAATPSQREGRDNLILHEMAHMWFGDLVTMTWWDDLWLNESFASYLASIAQDRALNTKSTWQEFASDKNWGYWQDQLVTTHPIETVVPDTRTARGNFDGITYAKGASALKQLHFYVGEKAFMQGLQQYFKDYAFKNATRADFIGHIAKAAGTNLDGWVKKWLQTSGPNRVTTQWQCETGLIKSFKVVQRPSSSGHLSHHRTRIGLYMIAPDGTFTLERTADVSYQGQTTEVSAFHHRACPDFVMPNQDDHDYALFSLDPVSQTHAAKAVAGGIKDSLVRLQLWSIMGQMVRDRELTPASLMDIALVGLEAEREDLLLGILLKSYSPISSSYFHYFTPQQRQKFAPAFEAMLWRRIVNAAPGSGEQLNFFDYYVSVAQTDEAVAALYNMFEKNSPPSGIELGPNRRWAIINKLSSFKHPEALNLISTEEKRDTTTMGERFAYGGKIAFPTIENKKKYWEEFKNVAAIGANKFQSGANYFHSIHQQELAAMFADDFFNRAKTIDWEKEEELIEPYFESLFPAQLCNLALLKRSQSEINRAKNLTSLSRRAWLEANDELERCVKIRQTLTSKNK